MSRMSGEWKFLNIIMIMPMHLAPNVMKYDRILLRLKAYGKMSCRSRIKSGMTDKPAPACGKPGASSSQSGFCVV